jgi:cation diffusion facilitator family transporter
MMSLQERAECANRITAEGVVVNVVLMIIKFSAGFFGHSQAMIADAVHTLSDFATDIVVFIGIRIARKPRDADHAYGHGKYETVAALIIGLALFVVGMQIGWNAIKALLQALQGVLPEVPSHWAFYAAIISIVSKEILYQKTIAVGHAIQSDAVIANAWHHRSDALSSVGTALGIGAATFLGEKWAVMDPVAAIVVSLLLMQAAGTIMKEQIGGLTEKSLSKEIGNEILAMVTSFPDLSFPHNLRTRKVGSTVVIDLHVRVNPDMRVADAHAVVSQLEAKLRQRFGSDTIANVHIEPVKPQQQQQLDSARKAT